MLSWYDDIYAIQHNKEPEMTLFVVGNTICFVLYLLCLLLSITKAYLPWQDYKMANSKSILRSFWVSIKDCSVCIITIQANNSQSWESKAEKISIIKSPHTNIAFSFPTETSCQSLKNWPGLFTETVFQS